MFIPVQGSSHEKLKISEAEKHICALLRQGKLKLSGAKSNHWLKADKRERM